MRGGGEPGQGAWSRQGSAGAKALGTKLRAFGGAGRRAESLGGL